MAAGGGNGGGVGGAEDDGATDSADEFPPGAVAPSPPTTTRSVSATLQYEREQRPRAGKPSPRSPNASDTRLGTHHSNSHAPPQTPQTSSSHQQQPHNARDTFLNYFFGQNGPGPVVVAASGGGHAAGSGAAGFADGIGPSGRDVSSAPGAAQRSGLSLAGKLDGNSAAYDMKSLGKHIEAVAGDGTQFSARESMEINLIRSLIVSYFSIVRESIEDLVPKAIMHLLVNHSAQQVQNRLVSALYKPTLFGELLNEDAALVAERARVKALLDAYRDAFKTLSEISLVSSA